MKKTIIREYTILFQYLLLLKEPTYLFLIQIFHHLSPSHWWEMYIEPVLQYEKKENFKYLDISDLLNVFKMNWDSIFKYLDGEYTKYKYDNEYRLVNRVHKIRTIVAHANDADMSPFIFTDSLSCFLKYARLIEARGEFVKKLEADLQKYQGELPKKIIKKLPEESLKVKILTIIEDKVLLKAKSCDTLPRDIKLSIDRTIQRLDSMRTLDEIVGFFNNSFTSERGHVVYDALRKEGLLGFEDIKEEINALFPIADED